MEGNAALTWYLRGQCDLITRDQLRDAGVSRAAERAQTDARRWRALNNLVICTHNGPLTREQARWAVYLSCTGLRAMCGLTGMEQWSVRGFATQDVHMLVVKGDRVLPVPGVTAVIHESRRFVAEDVYTARAPAVTSLTRSTIDAAAWTSAVTLATRIAVAPVQQRLLSAQRLAEELAQAGSIRHVRVLRPLFDDLVGGAQALSEVEFLRWCRRHGFPKPELQVRLDRSGRRRWIDATFKRRDGSTLYAEIDGGIHLDLATRWLDTIKDNDMVITGKAGLRFPSIAIYLNHPVAVAQLREALQVVRG